MRLTLVRHGETTANRDGITQGQLDTDLTELGRSQAGRIGGVLSDETFHRIVTSDLKRCMDTAAAISRHHENIPVEYDKRLREYSFGIHQGKPTGSWDWPDAIDVEDIDARAPKGESARDVTRRIVQSLNELYSRDSEQHVLIVTHGGVIRLLRVLLGEVQFHERMSQPVENVSVWRFVIEKPLEELK
ncbi:histidine phosphatase family protein [Candidatus Saccharibacteria bacterium]|nr:histidine phosphatase family protein [Candidatus Saccharibacteria bacterium]